MFFLARLRRFRRGIAGLVLGLTGASSAWGAVTLPALISDHMVLQRSGHTALWGTASPGEKVTATLDRASAGATADAEGNWRLTLDLSQLPEGPFDLVIAGENRIVISDVLIGEVWLASGQSNMGFSLSGVLGAKEEIAGSLNPRLRQFQVGRAPTAQPQTACTGTWIIADPAHAGSFTAVGYYFGKDLQEALHTPVAVINSSVGGTPIEAWTSLEALNKDPELAAGAVRHLQADAAYDAAMKTYLAQIGSWLQQYNRADHPSADPAAFPPDAIPPDAKPVTLPGVFSAAGLPEAGATWIWKKITVDPSLLTHEMVLNLGTPDGFETVYWNGKKIGQRNPTDTASPATHIYYATAIQPDNLLAVRLYSPGGHAGLQGDVKQFFIGPQPLQGQWMGKAEYEFPPLSADISSSFPQMPHGEEPRNRPAYLFNGMIHPLLPYTIRGAVWYQGESNTGRAAQYARALPLLIDDWRGRWNDTFPFYICQLPNFMAKKPLPGESAWAELREAQTKALALPKTGEAVLIDLGEEGTVHPIDKHEVGERVSLLARAKTYGQPVPFSGPVYHSFSVEGNKIRIDFEAPSGGLVARPLPATYQPLRVSPQTVPLVRNSPDSPLEGFAICGPDRHWVWARATIDGDSVLVESPDVPNPVAVRYAWADNPTCNLYNQAGLPAGPFRTDTFPLSTEKAKF